MQDQTRFKRKQDALGYPECVYNAQQLRYIRRIGGKVMAQFNYTMPQECQQVLDAAKRDDDVETVDDEVNSKS